MVLCEPYGSGHINDTYRIVTDIGVQYILQRINAIDATLRATNLDLAHSWARAARTTTLLLQIGISLIAAVLALISALLIRRSLRGTVFTYYRALHDLTPAEGRRQLLETPREAWAEGILGELERVHPDIRRLCTRLDVFANGHAMRRPVPDSLWSGQREKLAEFRHPRIALAHADLSGFSLFEEAQYRGVLAAERVLARQSLRRPIRA